MTAGEYIAQMCEAAHLDQAFFDSFIIRLKQYEDIKNEFIDYINTGELKCDVIVSGYTAADLLVWQIDHFKSHMDRGEYDYQSNQSFMVLMAYDTLLKMKEDPAPIIAAFTGETGTDYAEKY